MANVDQPFGLKPIRHRNGAPYNGAVNLYFLPSSDSAKMYVGDPVVRTGTATARGVPHVAKATAGDGNAITGVIIGFKPDPDNDGINYRPASTDRYVLVADDPDLVFTIQADSAGTIAAAQVGLNAVLIYTHSGNDIHGISGAELDTTSDAPAADASNQLTIRRLHDAEGNDFGAHAVVEVTINNHTEAHGALGI